MHNPTKAHWQSDTGDRQRREERYYSKRLVQSGTAILRALFHLTNQPSSLSSFRARNAPVFLVPRTHINPTSDFYQINTCGSLATPSFHLLLPPFQPPSATGPPTDAFSARHHIHFSNARSQFHFFKRFFFLPYQFRLFYIVFHFSHNKRIRSPTFPSFQAVSKRQLSPSGWQTSRQRSPAKRKINRHGKK